MRKSKTLQNLQAALSMELTAAHQYQLHSHVFQDWGLAPLAAKMHQEMQEELGHADNYIARIMFLKGDPVLELARTPDRFANLVEMFKEDLADEQEAISFYTKAAQQAAEDGDIGTRALFERIVLDEENHMSWLELQLDLIKRIGEPVYFAKHMSSADENAEA